MAQEEQVLVVETKVVEQIGLFHGLQFDIEPYLDALFAEGVPRFMPRSEARMSMFSMRSGQPTRYLPRASAALARSVVSWILHQWFSGSNRSARPLDSDSANVDCGPHSACHTILSSG